MAEERDHGLDAEPAGGGPGGRRARLRAVRERLARWWRALEPAPHVRRGAALGIAILAGVLAALLGASLRPGFGRGGDVVLGALAGLLVAWLAGHAVIAAVRLLGGLPRFVGWRGLGALGALVVVLMAFRFPLPLALTIAAGLALVHALLGGALAATLGGGFGRARPARRAFLALALTAGLAANVVLVWWLADRGSAGHLVEVAPDPVAVPALAAADPSQPGPYRVLTLTYGSGTDRRRSEFGAAADLKTAPVDATPFVDGNEGWKMDLRHWYWGFDFEAFPVNGRVWYPDGPGPFPLVLVVHGNHVMDEYSDPGYAYLGELLASRGFILSSVDENFFNGWWPGGIDTENDGRGWMLLQHLKVFRDWSTTPGNPFHRKVDLERIALMGHSRGGEAAAIAGAFNRLARYPDDATVELPSGFGVRAVVAIAPSDGQYEPAGRPTPLRGVSYLTLQGGHDADVSVFLGDRQYRRVELGEGEGDGGAPRFKASVYAYRANHGQFNTVWGDADFPWPISLLLNREPLLPAEAQRRIAEVYIAGFLEATLHGDAAYLPLFRDHRSAAAWLPQDDYVTRFRDTAFHPVAHYEEDVDTTTASLDGAVIQGEGLAVWREEDLPLRNEGTKQNGVAVLGWRPDPAKPGEVARYSIALPAGPAVGWRLGPGASLVLDLADADEELPDPEDKEGKEEDKDEKDSKDDRDEKTEEEKKDKQPLDLSVELVAADGTTARLPLSRFRRLVPPLRSRFTKLWDEEDLYGKDWEPALQTFELPLGAFAAAAPGFDPAAVTVIHLVFDRSPEGVVILDEVGFAGVESAAPAPASGLAGR